MQRIKHCPTCAVSKKIAEFGRDRSRLDGLQSQCRICKRIVQKNWYYKNKARHITNVARRRRSEETKTIRSILTYLRQHPCVDCGEDNPVVLEFDHVKGNKLDSVCNLIRHGCSWAKIYAEIQKCDVRCCNCHRRKTAKQYGYRKMLLAAGA